MEQKKPKIVEEKPIPKKTVKKVSKPKKVNELPELTDLTKLVIAEDTQVVISVYMPKLRKREVICYNIKQRKYLGDASNNIRRAAVKSLMKGFDKTQNPLVLNK